MKKHKVSVDEAVSLVVKARPVVGPNEFFMEQLKLYGEMNMPDNVEEVPAYQRWLYQLELSQKPGQAPGATKIWFGDEHQTDTEGEFELRCRKCRYGERPYQAI